MLHFKASKVAILAAVSALGVGLSNTAYARSYTITNLGNFQPADINDSHQIVGNIGTTAAEWIGGVTINLSGDPAGVFTAAYAINNAGQVAGVSNLPGGLPGNIATVWNGGIAKNLGLPSGYLARYIPYFGEIYNMSSLASAINDNGKVAGTIIGTDINKTKRTDVAAVWSGDTITTLIGLHGTKGPLDYATDSAAGDINNSGQVVGVTYNLDGVGATATEWSGGRAINLGVRPGYLASYAVAINNSGQVVVNNMNTSIYKPKPEMITEWSNGRMSVLGLGSASDINDAGQVVGCTDSSNGYCQARLWSEGSVIDLSQLFPGWIGTNATAINDAGQIVGVGINSLGQSESFLLSTIPEPSTWAMMLLGFAGVSYAGYRRARGQAVAKELILG